MWTIASTTGALSTAFTDIGTVLSVVIGTVLVGLVALLGLGFGVRQAKKHITGKKF